MPQIKTKTSKIIVKIFSSWYQQVLSIAQKILIWLKI